MDKSKNMGNTYFHQVILSPGLATVRFKIAVISIVTGIRNSIIFDGKTRIFNAESPKVREWPMVKAVTNTKTLRQSEGVYIAQSATIKRIWS